MKYEAYTIKNGSGEYWSEHIGRFGHINEATLYSDADRVKELVTKLEPFTTINYENGIPTREKDLYEQFIDCYIVKVTVEETAETPIPIKK